MKQLSIEEQANRIKHLIYYGNYKDEVLDTDTHKIDWAFEQMFIMAEESLRFKMPAVKELFWKRVALLSNQPTPAKIDLEELRGRFKNWIETTHSDKIFNWFSPFLSNNTEELQKENEDLKSKLVVSEAKAKLNYSGLCEYEKEVKDLTAKLKECEREKKDILLLSYPWPLKDVLRQLVKATDILLKDKSYDGNSYEEIQTCSEIAKNLIIKISKAPNNH